MVESDVKEAVLQIYDTVVAPEKWAAVLDRIVDTVDAKGCIIFGWNYHLEKPRLVAPHHSSFYQADILEGYIARYWREEERDQAIFRRYSLSGDTVELIDDSVLATDEVALAQLGNIKAMQRFGIKNRSISLLNKDDTNQSRFSIQLGEDRGRLNTAERAFLTAILPHMAKALELGRPVQALAQSHGRLLAAMDRLKVGLCVLDDAGRIAARNVEFTRQQDEHAVFGEPGGGRLVLKDESGDQQLNHLTRDLRNHGRFGARPRKEAISLADGNHLCVEVVPLDQMPEMGSKPLGGALVFSTDTSQGLNIDGLLVQRAFGLTEAEIELTKYIAQGLTNAQIAQRRDRSIDTINVQVKSILSKTDSANRTQLVRVLMNFGANFIKI